MKTVKSACVLQDNALSINVSDQIEQLDELINAEEGGEAFFERTFITHGMQELLSGTIARLAGQTTTAVYHLKQAMGGGKTHLLVGAGLVAKNPKLRQKHCANIPHIDKFKSARVAAFNGRNNPPEYFWGAVAKQLGAESQFARYWQGGPQAPDEAAWLALLKSDTPTMILFDEMPPYFQFYGTQPVGAGTVADIVTRAFANLLVAAGKLRNVCVVVSDLAASYGTGAGMISQALADAQKELGRQEKSITPVDLAGSEVYDILRKRLFKKLPDSAVIDDIASRYGTALAEAAKAKTVGRGAEALAEEVARTYPFHPRLKNLVALFKENEQFKQTRGLMELASRLLKSAWSSSDDIYLIGAQHFDLSIPEVREKLVEISGMNDVIAHDIWDSQGAGEAQKIDAQTGNRAGAQVAALLLTASLSTAINAVKGLTEPEILECLVTPLDGPDVFRAAFGALESGAWYLHHNQEQKYYFDRQENLTKLLHGLATQAPENQIDELVKKRLESLFSPERKSAYVKVLALPKLDEVTEEVRRNRILLIVSPDSKIPPEAVRQFFESLTAKNNVLVLTGEKTQMASIEKAARNVYAGLKADTRIPRTHAQREEYEQKVGAFEHAFTSTVQSIFDKVMVPFQRPGQQPELRAKSLAVTRDTKEPFKGEDQVEKTLAAHPVKLYLDVEKDFDALRDQAEDQLWPEGSNETRWTDAVERAQNKAAMPWLPPKGLDTLRALCITKGRWEDLGNGYVSKVPTPKRTSVQVTAETEPDDNGFVRLRVSSQNAGAVPRIHYAEDGKVSERSPQLNDDTLTTKALRVQFLAVDPTGINQMGDAVSWQTTLKLRCNLVESGGKRMLELHAAPSGKVRYTTDGREPRDGDLYKAPFDIGPKKLTVLAFAEADGIETKASFNFPAQGQTGPDIGDARPAVLTAAAGTKAIGNRALAFEVAKFLKDRGVEVEKVRIMVGNGAKMASLTIGEFKVDGASLEAHLQSLSQLLDPTEPVHLAIGRAHFASGHDLKQFIRMTGFELKPGEVQQ